MRQESRLLFTATMFVFESLAECLAVWIDDPILGMLQFMNVWFASFLFGGFLIPFRDLYWPFTFFYYVRSSIYEQFVATTFEPCVNPLASAVCTPSTDGSDVLDSMNRMIPLISSDNKTLRILQHLLPLDWCTSSFMSLGYSTKPRSLRSLRINRLKTTAT
jgi:hypothetical protein